MCSRTYRVHELWVCVYTLNLDMSSLLHSPLSLPLSLSLSLSLSLTLSLFLSLSLSLYHPHATITRRLSSKKRKKVASQLQQSSEGGASGSSDKCSSCSPMGSANGSPAVTSTTCTPPAFDSKRLVAPHYKHFTNPHTKLGTTCQWCKLLSSWNTYLILAKAILGCSCVSSANCWTGT